MKKSNRKSKKNRKNHKCNGYNVFGERCIEKELLIVKETAWEQFMGVIDDFNNADYSVEYTFTYSGFSDEELKEFMKKVEKTMAVRAYFRNGEFRKFHGMIA